MKDEGVETLEDAEPEPEVVLCCLVVVDDDVEVRDGETGTSLIEDEGKGRLARLPFDAKGGWSEDRTDSVVGGDFERLGGIEERDELK